MFGKPKEGATAPAAGATDQQAPGALGSDAPSSGPRKVTPVDIQQKEFRLAFRGYSEREVDQFLDDVTEVVDGDRDPFDPMPDEVEHDPLEDRSAGNAEHRLGS